MMKKILFLAFLSIPFICRAQAQNNFQRTPKGIQYRIITHGTGAKIKLEDVITFQAVQKTEKDSVLFSSYAIGHPVKIQVKPSENIGDLMDLFPLLTINDSVMVRLPTDSVFAGHEDARPPFLPKGTNMLFILKIEKVQSLTDAIAERNATMDKFRADETAAANKYIDAHKLAVKTTPSGLKYVITHASVKRKVMPGDTLLVNYAGRTTDDKLFDTSIETLAKASGLQQPGRNYAPLKVVVGQSQVIKGWDEGLLLLNEGSKAKFVIPSNLAYGEQGAGDDIKPFSTLIFDVEVVKAIPPKLKTANKTAAKTTATAKKKVAKKPVTTTAAKKPAAPVKKPAAAPAKKN